MNIEEIKVRLDSLSKRGFEGFEAKENFHANAESDIDYLLSIIEQAEEAFEQINHYFEAEEYTKAWKETTRALQVIRGK